MAKRAKDVEAYRPVHASLVAEVLAGGSAPAPAVAPAPRSEDVRMPPPRQQADVLPLPAAQPRWEPRSRAVVAPEPEPEPVRQATQALDPRKRLSREKRYLLSPEEEDRIEDLVRNLARELQTPLKLSHLVRATVSLIARSQAELLGQARTTQVLSRPSNGDTPGLLRFEAEVAKLLDAAFRMTKPM